MSGPPTDHTDRSRLSVAAPSGLAADAVRVLTDWPAPTAAQDEIRIRVLGYLGEHGETATTRVLRPGHLTTSAVLLDASRSQVLLTLHALARQWLQLGGHPEPGDESLVDAAAREVREESGISGVAVDPVPLAVDWHRVRCRDTAGDPGPSAHLDVTFLAVAPPGARHRISDESLALRWFDVEGLPDGADETVRRCVRAAVQRSAASRG